MGRVKDLKAFHYLCIDSCTEDNIYLRTNTILQNTAALYTFLLGRQILWWKKS